MGDGARQTGQNVGTLLGAAPETMSGLSVVIGLHSALAQPLSLADRRPVRTPSAELDYRQTVRLSGPPDRFRRCVLLSKNHSSDK